MVLTERASSRKEHSTDERADMVAFAPDVEDADADDEDDPSRSDTDLSDDEDGWGLAEMVTFHPDTHFAFCAIAFYLVDAPPHVSGIRAHLPPPVLRLADSDGASSRADSTEGVDKLTVQGLISRPYRRFSIDRLGLEGLPVRVA